MSDHELNESDHQSEFLKKHTLINNYSIIEKIATGGMGDIYLAEDEKLNRKVVLKLITGKKSQNDKYKEMLIHEARLSAGLNHSNIVTIHEIIEFENQPVIVMEHIDGDNLQDLLKTKSFELKEITEIISQIASALSKAHSVGIIHGDIKASNILINENNQVKILDFGLARSIDETDPEMISNSSGTLYYMSPEQINNSGITCQSDLFSLGVVFYQLLTGKLPFTGDYEAAIKYAISNEEPQMIAKDKSLTDDGIKNIILKLLKKNPQERYKSADELLTDLELQQSSDKTKSGSIKNIFSKRSSRIVFSIIILILLFYTVSKFTAPDVQGELTLAVLPFENLGDSEDDYFADGMTDALTMNLAQINEIEVRSRNSSMLYKNSKLGSKIIGEELNVRYLLTGRIYWDKSNGNEVRIYSDLLDIEADKYLWTYQYDVSIEKIFEIQTKISKKIINSLPLALSDSENEKLDNLPTDKIDAYIMYTKGNEYFNRSWEQDHIMIALDMFEKAVDIDQKFSSAYAMIARCYASLYWDRYNYSQDICLKSKEYAEKSLSFTVKPVEGYMAMGYYYYHCEQEYAQALEYFNQGLELYPNTADLYNAVAAVQRRQGLLIESCNNFKYALELDPRSHLKASDIAFTFGMLRNHDSALYYIERATELAPDYSLAHIYNAWLPIIKDGNIESAKEIIQKGLLSADLKGSKYYWWLLRIIDPKEEMEYGYKKTPGTDSISYYLYMSQRNRLTNNYSSEKLYADSVILMLGERIKLSPNDARLNIAMGLAYAGLRDKEKAMYYGLKACELAPVSKEAMDAPFIILDFAEILLIFEDYDNVSKQLEFLLSIPGFVTPVYFQSDPLWKPLFEDSTFSNKLFN